MLRTRLNSCGPARLLVCGVRPRRWACGLSLRRFQPDRAWHRLEARRNALGQLRCAGLGGRWKEIIEFLNVGSCILPPELFRNRVVSVGLGVVSRCPGTLVVGTSKPIMAIGISVRRAKLE